MIESERFFSAQKYLPKPSSKTTQPPKKRKAQPTFFLTVSPGPLCPQGAGHDFDRVEYVKGATGVLDPDGMAGQICVVFCFYAETCFFLKKKHEELNLEIEYRMEMFSFCSCSTIDLQLAHTYHPWGFVG